MTAMNRLNEAIERYGEWTAMSIKLADGAYTREQAPDHRLKRLLQVCNDLVCKPLSECRVLDLACLEGHYAIEFARHGSDVVGIEGRAEGVAKCDFVKAELGLTRAAFYHDDVRNLSARKYGEFDIVICSGLIYHLQAQDAWKLIRDMYTVCRGIVLIDTFVALAGRERVEVDGSTYYGHVYGEHSDTETAAEKQKKRWASLDNNTSFWFTEPSLLNLLARAGFTTTLDVLTPTMPGNLRDRKTYIVVKGKPATVLTSDETQRHPHADIPEGLNPRIDPSQIQRGALFLAAKRILPQGVKDAIKPALRALKLLPPDGTPQFQRKSE